MATFCDMTYTWDANKNKTSESITGVMSGYGFTSAGTTYDNEDRLTGFSRAATSGPALLSQSWNLTSVGDWTSVTTNGTAQNRTHGPTHELLTAGGQNVATDVKGNITTLPANLRPAGATTAMNLTWDSDNKLWSADIDANGTADVNFQYDALGRRVARSGTGGSVVFVQMDQQTIADYPVGGAATTPTFRYVYASYIDEPVVRKGPTSTSTVHFYHRNHQYSITAVTTSTGSIAERYAYSAYGQPTILDASASVLSSSAINNRYTYTGREWDATLGLHHFRARWMSPSAGRFLRRDPIEYEGSEWGLYEFVKAGCLCFADPDGMEREIPCDAPALALARNACLRYGGINPAKPTKCYLRPGNLVVVKAFCNHTGDCYADQYRIIDEMKEAYCDAPRSCEKFNCPCDKNDCGLIWNRIRDGKGCLRARAKMTNTCFKGKEDEGHRQARENTEIALVECEKKRKACNCRYVFTPEPGR